MLKYETARELEHKSVQLLVDWRDLKSKLEMVMVVEVCSGGSDSGSGGTVCLLLLLSRTSLPSFESLSNEESDSKSISELGNKLSGLAGVRIVRGSELDKGNIAGRLQA